jgi:hypothetical protein
MNKKPKGYYKQKGFLETLKELGTDVARSASEDVVRGTAEEAVKQITGKEDILEQGQTVNVEEYISQREKNTRGEERHLFEIQRAQEKAVSKEEQQKIALQIKAIQVELKKLVIQTDDLSRELKTAAVEATVDPGNYHVNFLENLLKIIKLVRKKVQKSKTWLTEWNAYCKKKRCFYWAQVKKSGTKFMLSSERYMSTQAG